MPTLTSPRPRPLAGLSKSELRTLCATHFRAAVAREAQGKEFILRAKAGAKTAPRAAHAAWRKDEADNRTFGAFNKTNPHTRKRWSYTENK
jgi:hypothetical protein